MSIAGQLDREVDVAAILAVRFWKDILTVGRVLRVTGQKGLNQILLNFCGLHS